MNIVSCFHHGCGKGTAGNLVRRLAGLQAVCLRVGRLPTTATADGPTAESFDFSIVALPFGLSRTAGCTWLFPVAATTAATAAFASKSSAVLRVYPCLCLGWLLAAPNSVSHLTAVVAFDLGPVLVIANSLVKT
jgi:hypothetical protein